MIDSLAVTVKICSHTSPLLPIVSDFEDQVPRHAAQLRFLEAGVSKLESSVSSVNVEGDTIDLMA